MHIYIYSCVHMYFLHAKLYVHVNIYIHAYVDETIIPPYRLTH